jgi:hypothetical protein
VNSQLAEVDITQLPWSALSIGGPQSKPRTAATPACYSSRGDKDDACHNKQPGLLQT